MLIDTQVHCHKQNYAHVKAVTDPSWGLKHSMEPFFGRALAGVSLICRKRNFIGLGMQWN